MCSCPEQYFDQATEIIKKHKNNRNVFESWGRKKDASSGMARDTKKSKEIVNTCGEKGQYTGAIANGKANGKGEWVADSGNKYVGEWKDDKRHGPGTVTLANGDKYVGD